MQTRRTITDAITAHRNAILATDTSTSLDCSCSGCDAEAHGDDSHRCVAWCELCRTGIRDAIVRHAAGTVRGTELLADLALQYWLLPDDLGDLSGSVRGELVLMVGPVAV